MFILNGLLNPHHLSQPAPTHRSSGNHQFVFYSCLLLLSLPLFFLLLVWFFKVVLLTSEYLRAPSRSQVREFVEVQSLQSHRFLCSLPNNIAVILKQKKNESLNCFLNFLCWWLSIINSFSWEGFLPFFSPTVSNVAPVPAT